MAVCLCMSGAPASNQKSGKDESDNVLAMLELTEGFCEIESSVLDAGAGMGGSTAGMTCNC